MYKDYNINEEALVGFVKKNLDEGKLMLFDRSHENNNTVALVKMIWKTQLDYTMYQLNEEIQKFLESLNTVGFRITKEIQNI